MQATYFVTKELKAMKQLIQYNSKCLNSMYDYLQDGQLTKMCDTLTEVEDYAISKMETDRDGESLWFKFSGDDTLATDIKDLHSTLKFGTKENQEFYRELMEYACKHASIEVYFS